jgi:hypothetical protein
MLDAVWWLSAGENQKARFCSWFSAGEHPQARFCPRLAHYRARPEITKRQIAHAAPADAEAVWRISSKENLKARFCSRFSARGSVRDSLPKPKGKVLSEVCSLQKQASHKPEGR